MSINVLQSGNCPICNENLENGDVVQIHQKGADGINAASIQRGDSVAVKAGCKVHANCRKRYTNKLDIVNQQKGVDCPIHP